MVLREQDRHFLWSMASAFGLILSWRGIWEGIYYIPILGDPWVFLFFGLTMLTFSGAIFKEFDPLGGIEKSTNKIVHFISNHPNRKDFEIKYHDKEQKEDLSFLGANILQLEKGMFVIYDPKNKQEVFIPTHRITEVLFQGRTYWKL